MSRREKTADLTFMRSGNLQNSGEYFTVQNCVRVSFVHGGGVVVKIRLPDGPCVYRYIPRDYRLILIERTEK